MNDKQRAKWERTRAKGIWRFILLNAILFGVALVVATSIFDYFTSFNGFRFESLYIKVPIYLVTGVVFGLIMWFIGEYQYQKNSKNIQRLNGKL